MNRTWKVMGMVVALALATAPAVAQGPGRGHPQGRQGQGMMRGERGMMRGGPGTLGRNPAAIVLDHQEELELTADQVRQVTEIRDELEAANAPRIQRIMDAIGDVVPSELTIEERYELRETMQELQPVRDEIRTANREAGQKIHALLNQDQEKELFGIMHADRGPGERGMRQRRPMGPRGRRGPGGGPPGGG